MIYQTILVLFIYSLAGFAMEPKPYYTQKITSEDTPNGHVIIREVCAFGDKKYPDNYCVSSFREYLVQQDNPYRKFIADQELREKSAAETSIWQKLNNFPAQRQAVINFHDIEDKFNNQEKKK